MKRRPNGKGSIRHFPKRTKPWQACTPRVMVDGKKKRILLGYFEEYEDAEAVLNKWLRNRSPKINYTFKDVYDEWSERAYEEITKSTADCYRAAWKQMGDLYDMKASEIRTGHFQTIIDVMKKAEKSYSSLHNVKVLAGLIEKRAMQYDIISMNYAEYISLPPAPTEEKEAFTEDQIKAIEKAAEEGDYTAKLVVILNYTGWRIGEFLELKAEDYDPEFKTFKGGKKTDAGKDRIVPVHAKVQSYVDELLAMNGPQLVCRKVVHGRKPNQYTELVPVTPGYFRKKMFTPLMEKLGITNSKGEMFTPHATRHTFASACRKQGVDPLLIKRLMGHSRGNDVTERVYTHVDIEQLVNAISAIIFYKMNKA